MKANTAPLIFATSLFILLISGCTTTQQPYARPYVAVHPTPVAVNSAEVPRLDYDGSFEANWYGGSPNYFNTSVIIND